MSDPEAQRWTRPGFAAVADQVYAHCGLAVPPYRRQAAEAGMRLAMQRLGLDDIDVLGARIRTDRAALEVLVDELAVGETYFFREPAQFGALRDHILPDLLARRPAGHRLRVWSAGCASGEEAYSLAILFAEMGLGERVDLLATDVSAEKLARARAGRVNLVLRVPAYDTLGDPDFGPESLAEDLGGVPGVRTCLEVERLEGGAFRLELEVSRAPGTDDEDPERARTAEPTLEMLSRTVQERGWQLSELAWVGDDLEATFLELTDPERLAAAGAPSVDAVVAAGEDAAGEATP